MSQLKKLIVNMKRQPNNVSPDDLLKVLNVLGYRLDRQKGSHMQFINESGDVITIPKRNPLRAVYVKDVLNKVDEELIK